VAMITAPEPDTRQAAISLVTAALRGDVDAVRCVIDAYDVDEFVPAVHAALALARAIAVQLRSPQGLMGADVWLAECSRGHPCRDTRIAAELILAHALTVYPQAETVAVAETFGPMFNIGASTFNEVCCVAGDRFVEIFTAATVLWHQLLPELGTTSGPIMVGNVAGQLWASAEPTPPKPIEGTETLRTKTNAEDSPPRPHLAAPPETEVVQRPYRPYQAYLPAGAPVSLRGLAIRRQQERGIDVVYG
jgi:hypothetical protein